MVDVDRSTQLQNTKQQQNKLRMSSTSPNNLRNYLGQIGVMSPLETLVGKFGADEYGFPDVKLTLQGNSKVWLNPNDSEFYKACTTRSGSNFYVEGVPDWKNMTQTAQVFLCLCAAIFANHPDEWDRISQLVGSILDDSANKKLKQADAALFQWLLDYVRVVNETGVWTKPAGPEAVFGALASSLAFKGPSVSETITKELGTAQGQNKHMAAYRDLLRSFAASYESSEEEESESSEEESSSEEEVRKKKHKKSSSKKHKKKHGKRDASPTRGKK